MNKIQMTTPLVEMDGDEKTRILWKKVRLISTALILAFFIILLFSCSNDDEELSESSIPEKVITGKWKLQKVGSYPWKGKEKTLLFHEDGTVLCHSEYQNYQGSYEIRNASFQEGTIYCIVLINEDSDNIAIPYECSLQKKVMTLNNMNLSSVVDATETYIKIK